MPELHELLARRASGYEPPPDLFDRVLDRRRRRDRNRRVGTVVVALALTAAAIGVLTRAFMTDAEPRPADQTPRPFVGAWASTNYHEPVGQSDASNQTMTIRAGDDGAVHITVHDDFSYLCSKTPPSDSQPATMTGTGRLEDPSTVVVPSPDVACVDGSDPDGVGPYRLEEPDSYTLVLDPATDRLYDNLGVVWNRGAPPENWTNPSTEARVDGPGTFAMLHGEVTFRTAEPWGDHLEAYLDPRLFFLVTGRGEGTEEAFIEILVNPLPPDTPCESLRVPPSAEELVQTIRSNPNLEATAPVTERVGGIDALWMDVAATPGASISPCGNGVPVVSVPGREGWGYFGRDDLGRLGRIYVLDLPGGSARTLAIWLTAPDETVFEQAIETAAPILESFQFHTE